LQKIVQAANEFNLNSCEANEKLFSSITGLSAKSNQQNAAKWSKDFAADPFGSFFQANKDTRGSDAETNELIEKTVDKNPDNPAVKETLKPGNMVWNALGKHAGALTRKEKELFVSITGTLIFSHDKDNAASPMKAEYVFGKLTLEQLVGQISSTTAANATTVTASPIYLLTCTEQVGEVGDCIKMAESTVPSDNGTLKAMVHERLMSIKQHIVDRTKQDKKDVEYTEMISIPIQRMMAMGNSIKSMTISQSLNNRAEDIAAAEVAARMINDAITLVDEVITKQSTVLGGTEAGEVQKMKLTLTNRKREVHDLLMTAYANASNLGTLTRELEAMERTFTAGLSNSIKGNLAFQNGSR
jgi:hypothetical protein